METHKINGFIRTTPSLSGNSIYNLIATNLNQSFSCHLHITNHGVEKEYHTKTCNIEYADKTIFVIISWYV